MAQVDYFLKLTDIQGESHDAKHKGQIEIESFSWGASQTGTHGAGGGGGAGKVAMQDFHFVMKYNSASPKLMLACANGKHIKEGVLIARKAGGKQEPYLTYKLTDVLVSSYQTGGSAHGDVVPTDSVSINFSKIEVDYKQQDEKGAVANKAKAGWDLKQNKEV